MIKAVIFDFDGTILDTETPDYTAWQSVFADHDCELEKEIWGQVIGTNWDVFNPFDYLEQKTGKQINRDELHLVHRNRFHEMIEKQVPLAGVESALATFKEMGLTMAVASSSSRQWVTGHLARLKLLEYFSAVKTADDVERIKPDRALYREALKELRVEPSEAIAFEDSVNGVKAAKAAGIYCIAVPNSVTSHMDFQQADHRVVSLMDFDIKKMLADL